MLEKNRRGASLNVVEATTKGDVVEQNVRGKVRDAI